MTIVMKMPLKNCFTKCCLLDQSCHSKRRKCGLSATVRQRPSKSSPMRSFTCQMITTSVPTRQSA